MIMDEDIVEGRLIPHQHEKRDEWSTECWRLRNMLEHPIDPNWESGRYLRCHVAMRNNRKLLPNTMIFDLVGISGYGNKRFIRSAFLLKKIESGTLYFDSFLFADEDPLESPKNIIRHPYGAKLRKKESEELLRMMKKNGYNLYKAGQRPKSIDRQDWKVMKTIASRHIPKRHICH